MSIRYLWTSQKALGLALLLLIGAGYALFRYWQPLCEPCLSRTDCPPCLSHEQYVTVGIVGIVSLILLARILILIRYPLPKE
jgi:hypothetical protein